MKIVCKNIDMAVKSCRLGKTLLIERISHRILIENAGRKLTYVINDDDMTRAERAALADRAMIICAQCRMQNAKINQRVLERVK